MSREGIILALMASAFGAATCVMVVPRRVPVVQHFAGVGPFSSPPPLKPWALPIVFAVTIAVVLAGLRAVPRLAARPYRTAAGIFALGVVLHMALIASLTGGAGAFHRRALLSGHGEFLIEAVLIEDLPDTIGRYEAYVRGRADRIFLAQKGPGVLAFFYGLTHVGKSPFVRQLAEPFAPSARMVQSLLSERAAGASVPHVGSSRVHDLRYLLAVVILTYPLLTYLPIFIIVWLGAAHGDVRLGLLGGLLYLFVPAVALRVAHMDYAVFPLLASATLAWFVYGTERRQLSFVVASAVAFFVFFAMTLSAVSLLAYLLPFLGLVTLHRVANGEHRSRIVLELAAVAGVFALVCGLLLAGLSGWLQFDPVERYTYARSIQRSWVREHVSWFVFAWNLFGYSLSFGLLYTLCVLVQEGRSALRLVARAADSIDRVALSWLCLLAGLIAFGRQQGETDRLWAFLGPLGCLIAARFLHDSIRWRRLWFPVLLFALALVVARYHLDYL